MDLVEIRENGAHAVKAVTGSFALQKLRFPAGHKITWFEPEWGYLVVVLDGAMQKGFSNATWSLTRDCLASLPPGAGHSTDFGVKATHVLTIYPSTDESGALFTRFLRERRPMTAPAVAALGRRLAQEIEAPDASSGLAVEGLVLQMLAMGERESSTQTRRSAAWLGTVVEILRERTPQAPSLTELAAEAGVHPGHLARAFKQTFGVTVCEYSRTLRLEWAAEQLGGERALAQVAYDAGFADQSHFTRAFRRYQGVTPGRYRELLRR